MAVDKKISQLTSLAQVNVDAAADVLPIVDTSAIETKKITVSALVGAGATAGISGAVLTSATITTSTVNSTSVGATTPSTGAFTTLSASNGETISGGNLTFSSTAQRITGDMSNATLSNRLAFQTSTTNGNTTLNIIPNGTGTASQFVAHLGSDPANTSRAGININSTQSAALVFSDITGTGTYLPMTFFTGGSERVRIDTSGNVGIGTSSPDAKLTVSGAASFADGTASAPGIANTGDLDTGMYFPAANEAAITTGGTVAAAFNSNGLFFRNRIINGDMRIDQRNAGASVTLSTTTQYPVDRFPSYKGTAGATVTAQQSSTAPTGFTNSIIYTVSTGATPAAGDINSFWQLIEGFNVADLGWGTASAQTVTLSFWVRSSVTGTYSVSFSNSANNRFYVATYTVNSANTYEYKTITVAGDTSGTWLTNNGIGIQITWDLGYGTNFNGTAGSWSGSTIRRTSGSVQLIATTGATLYITGVQLETGSVATPFERRPFTTELQLCQRYYEKSFELATKPAQNTTDATGAGLITQVVGAGAIQYGVTIGFAVAKRAAPTVTLYNPNAANAQIRGTVGADWSSSTIYIAGQGRFGLYGTTPAGSSAGNGGVFHWDAAIEL